MNTLKIKIKYNLKKDEIFVSSSIDKKEIMKALSNYVKLQMGVSNDNTQLTVIKSVYTIDIFLDTCFNIIKISSDINNSKIILGIIIKILFTSNWKLCKEGR